MIEEKEIFLVLLFLISLSSGFGEIQTVSNEQSSMLQNWFSGFFSYCPSSHSLLSLHLTALQPKSKIQY